MENPAEGSLDDCARRCVAVIGDIPYPDKAQVRIEPWILRHCAVGSLQHNAVVQTVVKVVGCRQENSSPVHPELPGLIADACFRARDDCPGSYIAVVRSVEYE